MDTLNLTLALAVVLLACGAAFLINRTRQLEARCRGLVSSVDLLMDCSLTLGESVERRSELHNVHHDADVPQHAELRDLAVVAVDEPAPPEPERVAASQPAVSTPAEQWASAGAAAEHVSRTEQHLQERLSAQARPGAR